MSPCRFRCVNVGNGILNWDQLLHGELLSITKIQTNYFGSVQQAKSVFSDWKTLSTAEECRSDSKKMCYFFWFLKLKIAKLQPTFTKFTNLESHWKSLQLPLRFLRQHSVRPRWPLEVAWLLPCSAAPRGRLWMEKTHTLEKTRGTSRGRQIGRAGWTWNVINFLFLNKNVFIFCFIFF